MLTRALVLLTLSFILILGVGTSVKVAGASSTTGESLDWSRVVLASGSQVPPPRVNAGMIFDPLDGYLLLYGGWNNVSNYLSDTWIFSHNSWRQLSPTINPGQRSDASMAYDPSDGYVLLYGGDNGTSQLNDTWEYHDGTWMRVQTTTAPAVRQDASMIYDSAEGNILLFGGVNKVSSNFHYYNDTWTYKAGQWTMLTTAQAPSPRGAQGMVYDPAAGTALLFGGSSDHWSVNGGRSDTWKYQRGVWTEIYPSGSPDHRYSFGLVWDPAIAGDLFYGGWDPTGACGNDQNDTRIYRQESWRMLRPLNSPGERQAFGIDYDPAAGAVILFGGQENPGASSTAGCGTPVFMNDTWQYSLATSPINNPQNNPSLTSPPYLVYAIMGGVLVAGTSIGTYGWIRYSNGRKSGVLDEINPGPVCSKCGVTLPEGSAFCGKCGAQLES